MIGRVIGRWWVLALCVAVAWSGQAAAQQPAAGAAAQAATPKGVGASPPKLAGLEWVRGAPLRQFQRGTIYVLNFWAPWSGESLRTLGLLDTLGKQHAAARVQLVGVAVQNQPGTVPVDVFLKQRAADAGTLAYPVARDKVDETLHAWEGLIDLRIPRTVIIDRKGKIAWVGHPFDGLAEALAAVVADDAAALAALMAAREQVRTSAKPHMDAIQKAAKVKTWSKVPAEVDALLALDGRLYSPWALQKYRALVEQKQGEAAAAWGTQMVDGVCHDNVETLNELAWSIVGSDSRLAPEQRDLPLALAAARRADELSLGQDAGVLDTLAHAHAALGNLQEAVACETRAVAAAYSGDSREQFQKLRDAWAAQAAAPPAKPTAPPPAEAPPAGSAPGEPPEKPGG